MNNGSDSVPWVTSRMAGRDGTRHAKAPRRTMCTDKRDAGRIRVPVNGAAPLTIAQAETATAITVSRCIAARVPMMAPAEPAIKG
jgi:hypothetical protein